MSTEEFIIDLFCRVDAVMADQPKHPQAKLYPSEVVTLALLFALKGMGPRPFYRWLTRDYKDWFPGLPHRTRLFRLFATHHEWAAYFLAEPTLLGVADSYGIELRHPWREDRADQQIGGKGLSNHRWIVGVKLVYLVNQWGLVVGWDYAAANVPDTAFHTLIADFQDDMVIFTDTGFHATRGDPPNMKPCQRGTWNVRMVVETVLSMLTTVCCFKKRIVRAAADGTNNCQIVRQLDVSLEMVRRWRERWLARQPTSLNGLPVTDRLTDAPRPGKPGRITDEQVCQIVALACETPMGSDRPISQWTSRELADEIVKRGIVPYISGRHAARRLKRGRSDHT